MDWIKIPNTNEEISTEFIQKGFNWFEATEYCKTNDYRLPTFAETELVYIPKNFWEWTLDTSLEFPDTKILRGGSFSGGSCFLGTSVRYSIAPGNRSYLIGFRCVRKEENK